MATSKIPARSDAQPVSPVAKFLKIAAIQENGRHRAGRFWPQEPTTVAASEFDQDQLELLKGDKKLMVIEFDQVEQFWALANEPTES